MLGHGSGYPTLHPLIFPILRFSGEVSQSQREFHGSNLAENMTYPLHCFMKNVTCYYPIKVALIGGEADVFTDTSISVKSRNACSAAVDR